MTPEEKAKKLVNKFYYSLPNNGSIKEGINSCESRWKEAVMCALIALDEIINSVVVTNLTVAENQFNYWEEVKEEINKL